MRISSDDSWENIVLDAAVIKIGWWLMATHDMNALDWTSRMVQNYLFFLILEFIPGGK